MTKKGLLKKVRMFCAECMGGPRATVGVWPIRNPREVEDCCALECVWYEYRFGKDPDKPVQTPAQLAAQYRNLLGKKVLESTNKDEVVG